MTGFGGQCVHVFVSAVVSSAMKLGTVSITECAQS